MPILAIIKESTQHEKRVALFPAHSKKYIALGLSIQIEKNLGESIFYSDKDFASAQTFETAKETLANADIILKLQPPTLNEIALMKTGSILIGFLHIDPNSELIKALIEKKITSFAMERIPRISRAQNIDALSSQASLAGYKAVLMAADTLPMIFPMMTTAAGTIRPAKVLVIGAGVMGLQAIATARRLGALIEAYDVRPETKEQIESLGARFIRTEIAAKAEGGYARELSETEKKAQSDLLGKHIKNANVIICTAGVFGKAAPKIITKEMVEAMQAGSVIIDAMADQGGNCVLTEAGKTIMHHGVQIVGPQNLPSTLPVHASELYSNNCYHLVELLMKDKNISIDLTNEILAKSKVT